MNRPTLARVAPWLLPLLLFGAGISLTTSTTHAGTTVTIIGVAASHSSVKIFYSPVPGAKDYRVYDVTNPNNVKYAGWAHLTPSANCPGSSCFNHFVAQADGVTPVFPYQIASGASGGPQVLDVPATQIDWNNVGDGAAHTLVVEAVDQLGPAPPGNLYRGTLQDNTPYSNLPGMFGSNKGPTPDGKTSTNGQGPNTNNPQVIAQSAPFTVQANTSYRAIPSKASAAQTFFDTFENAENATIRQTYRNDTTTDSFGSLGQMQFTMNAGTDKAWEIEYRMANNRDSMPFISSDHFMDMMFDGATPGTSGPGHTLYGSMGMTPTKVIDISGGKILHMTMEVDGHQSFRRWIDFNLAPASDRLQGWDPNGNPVSNSDQAIFLEIKDGGCTLDIFTGPKSASDRAPTGTAGGIDHGARLWGQAGSTGGGAVMCGWDQFYIRNNLSKNAFGLDDKSRYDFFISATHAALFQDGQLIVQSDIPAGSFPWSGVPLRGYFSHYLYHSDNDDDDLVTFNANGQTMCYPLNSYWFNDPVNGTPASRTICNTAYPAGYGFPFSDERHWDNMGFEVLPASDVPANNFSSYFSIVQPPATRPVGSSPAAPTNLRIVGLLIDTLMPLRQIVTGRSQLAVAPVLDVSHGAHHHQ